MEIGNVYDKGFPPIKVREGKFIEVLYSNLLKLLFLEWRISKRETLLYCPNGMVRNSGLLLMRIGEANVRIFLDSPFELSHHTEEVWERLCLFVA